MSKRIIFVLVAFWLGACLFAQEAVKKRVKPPKWKKADLSIFFEDAFRDAIVGELPGSKSAPPANVSKPELPLDGEQWSRFVSSQTLEDEIKSLKIVVDRTVTTERRFKSGGFKVAKQRFSELAVLFGIVANYDQDVRWKDQAATARDRFAKTAKNSSVGSTAAFREAIERKNDLQDLISGAVLDSSSASDRVRSWEEFADRGALMQRLEEAHTERIEKWLSSRAEFEKHLPQIRREAEMLMALSVILTKENMEDGGDEDYAAYCDAMRDAAKDLIKGVQDEAFQISTQASGKILNSCAGCHDMYRG